MNPTSVVLVTESRSKFIYLSWLQTLGVSALVCLDVGNSACDLCILSCRLCQVSLQRRAGEVLRGYQSRIISCLSSGAISLRKLVDLLQDLRKGVKPLSAEEIAAGIHDEKRRILTLFNLAQPGDLCKVLKEMILTPLHVMSAGVSAAEHDDGQGLASFSKTCDLILNEYCLQVSESKYYQDEGCRNDESVSSECFKLNSWLKRAVDIGFDWLEHWYIWVQLTLFFNLWICTHLGYLEFPTGLKWS